MTEHTRRSLKREPTPGCGCGANDADPCADDRSPEPIACTPDGQGLRERLSEFRAAFARGYLGSERIDGGVRWRFRAAPGLEGELRSLAAREHECFRFFRFDIHPRGDEICWDTRVDDPAARPVLEEFFRLPQQLA